MIIPDRDKYRNYYLDERITHTLHNGDVLVLDKGYRFDAHSVPLLFRPLFPRYDKDIYAALIHDALIDLSPWHRYNRKFIDTEYKILMGKHSYGLRKVLMPLAVRLYGFLAFDIWGDYRGVPKPMTIISVTVNSDMV